MQGNASFNNHPTLTVDSASSLSAKVPVVYLKSSKIRIDLHYVLLNDEKE
jgi:hypothetical protein